MSIRPSRDAADARATLDAEGLAVLPGVLSADATADVRRRLFDACAASEADDVPTRGYAFDPDHHNRRVQRVKSSQGP